MDIREAIEDEAILNFVRKFNDKQTVIGAISIAPLILLKAGLLNKKPFMAGVNQEDLLEEGFSEEDLSYMVGWNDNIKNPVEKGYIISHNIITSVSYNFVKWALGFGKMIGIDIDLVYKNYEHNLYYGKFQLCAQQRVINLSGGNPA